MRESLFLLLSMVLIISGDSKDVQKSNQSAKQPVALEINLRDLGYQPTQEYRYRGTGIPRDLSILNDDYKKRIVFIDDKTLIVYQSHYQPQDQKEGGQGSRTVEAFVVDARTAMLISRRTWPTIERRWLNERWDTQARILAIQEGFLVQAGSSLISYSANQEQQAKLALETGPRWAVTVAPEGRTIHLQRIYDDNRADGEWLTSDSFTKLRSQHEMAGISSTSDDAVVDKLAHCVQVQAVDEAPRNLYCADSWHLGLPLFLTDTEVLSVYGKGFAVFSITGEKLWSREVTDGRPVEGYKRALSGSRFGLLVIGPTVFDQVNAPKGREAIVVYDRVKRTQIYQLICERNTERVDFELSPNGSLLAVLVGDTIRLYKIPE
jgi:hypothetical protein